jgi:hypothetical protein
MMVVDVSYGPSLKASKPRMLWRGNYLAGAGSSCGMAGPTSANYDVTADGERFLMIEDASSTAESERLRVVSNWSVELKNPGAINLQSYGWREKIRRGEPRQIEGPWQSSVIEKGRGGSGPAIR